jgi:glycosyltransferase involved in cell wall biosynthesis
VTILHWYPNFLDGGSVANAVLGLAAAEARQGAQVVIAAARLSRPPMYEPVDVPPDVAVCSWLPSRTLRIGGRLARLVPHREVARLRALHPDLVHEHGEFNLDNLWVPGLFRCPVVISPHGACHPVVLAKSRRRLKRLYLAAEDLLLRGHVSCFHALSPAEADHLKAVFPNGATYCVPQGPGVLVPQISPRCSGLQTAGGQKIRLLFVGRLDVFTKGLDILLPAFAIAASRWGGGRMHLVLAGPDWRGGRSWLEHRASELGIGERVEFTGPLRGRELGAVLAGADIYVQLSRHEGFPLSVAEALLASKPAVLSSAIGTISYPEIASLPHVRIVPPCAEKAARAMIAMAEGLPEMTSAALGSHQALRAFFSWDRVARLHLDQYSHLLRA